MIDYSSVLSKTVTGLKKSGIRKFFDLLNDESMKDVVGLTVGQPDFVTPWHIREAGIESLQKGKTYYSPNAGFTELQLVIAARSASGVSLNFSSNLVSTITGTPPCIRTMGS